MIFFFNSVVSDTPKASGKGAETTPSDGAGSSNIERIRPLFDKFAGADKKIDVYELQDMLTLTFSAG